MDNEVLDGYLRVWSDTLAAVLGQITGEPLPLAISAGEAAAAVAAEVFLNITLAGGVRGEQALALSAAEAGWLAGTFTGEAPAEGATGLTAEQQEAVEELFRQVAGQVASALRASWGEVQIHVQAGAAPSWPSAATVSLQSQAGEAPGKRPKLALELRLSAALAAALRRPEAAEAVAGATAGTPAGTTAPSSGSASGSLPGSSLPGSSSPGSSLPLSSQAQAAASKHAATGAHAGASSGAGSGASPEAGPGDSSGTVNLDFLRDVPLDLTLRFGQRRMLLREILELGPGSVIELDRRLREPVELLLDGRVLARGDVVVVEGCYGLRVTQIAAGRGGE